jgi:hypothetical protein
VGVIGEAAERHEASVRLCSAGGTIDPVDAHEVAQRRVEDARAALPELLRRAYALDEGQVATVLRLCDALSAGVSLEAREALGREALSTWNEGSQLVSSWEDLTDLSGLQEDWSRTGERLFALGRASVVPPDADIARVIAAWSMLDPAERTRVATWAVKDARVGYNVLAWDTLSPGRELPMYVTLTFGDSVSVIGCDVDGKPATAEQWARLRAAGVPVADGVGV